MTAGPRVLLMQLSERTSGKGNRYLSGWLGKASVVAFAGEPDKHGNPTWDLFVSEPQPRAERQADGTGEVRPRPEPSSRSAGTAAPNAPANRNTVHFTILMAAAKSMRVVGCGTRGRSL